MSHTSSFPFSKILGGGVLICLPWVFLFALPFLYFGVWMNIEGVAFALSALALIGGVALCFGFSESSFKNFSLSWPNIILLGLSIIGLTTLPFATLKDLSWMGHPEGCLGVWTSLALLTFSLLFQNLEEYHKAVKVSLILASTTLLILTVAQHPYYLGIPKNNWVLYHFTVYLIWPAVALLLIASTLETHTLKQRIWRYTLVIMAIFCIVLSKSKIAYIFLILSPLLLFKDINRRWSILIFCLALPFLTTIALIGAYYANLPGETSQSLISRYTSMEVVFEAFRHAHWSRLITGFGFGEMSDAIIQNRPFINLAAQGGWEGFNRFDSSSMNQFVDLIQATGVIGGMLWLVFFTFPLWRKGISQPILHSSPNDHQHNNLSHPNDSSLSLTEEKVQRRGFSMSYALSFGVILCISTASLWFMMLSTFSILFLAYLLIDKKQNDTPVLSFPTTAWAMRFLLIFISLTLSLSFAYTSYQFYTTGVFFSYDFKEHSFPVKLGLPEEKTNPTNLIRYGGPGHINLAFWLRHYTKKKIKSFDQPINEMIIQLQNTPYSWTLKNAIDDFYEK